MRQSVTAVLLISLMFVADEAWAQAVNDDFYITDGTVLATALSSTGDTLFLGGTFTKVGPHTGAGAVVDTAIGDLSQPVAAVEGGVVEAAAPDGSGGWFIGGTFTSVGGVARNRIAHIQSNGSVSSWNPNANGRVWDIVVSGSTVYVAGDFITIGGQSRGYIVALDATTGNATAWTPNANGTVTCLAISGSTVYAGGSFTIIGGQPRYGIAALDMGSNTATSFNPSANGVVYALDVSGSIVYAGGVFTTIGGASRSKLAAINAATGTATAWNPNATGGTAAIGVRALRVAGSTIYAGGAFTAIGGQTRNRIAAIDATTGAPTSWDPNAANTVWALMVSGTRVYVGGSFTSVGGVARNRVAALDVGTGTPTAWNPSATDQVFALAVDGGNVYVGGEFTFVGGYARNRIAALRSVEGDLLPWNPNANNGVRALVVRGSTLYVGGSFASIGGQTRTCLAALEASSGNATSWNPNASHEVFAMALSGSTLYAGGYFTTIGGQSRNYIAGLDVTTGNATSWNPNANLQGVRALAVSGSTVYAGGDFTTIGGQPRSYLAALDATSGNATAWSPNPNNNIQALVTRGGVVYAGGTFTNISGLSRNYIAALDSTTGAALPWSATANNWVRALSLNGSTLYAGGSFQVMGGQTRNRLAALDAVTGSLLPWNPNADNVVFALATGRRRVYAGGDFLTIGGLPQHRLAQIEALPEWGALASGPLGDTGAGRGVAWGDYDADGDLDLYLANLESSNRLFRNDGSFVDATPLVLDDHPGSRATIWGDMDCDRDLDLFLSRDGTSRLFRNDGGTFSDVSGSAIGTIEGSWRGAAWLDADGDRDLDVFVANEGGESGNKLFRNDAGTFVDGTSGALAASGPAFAVAPADFDNDGDTDLYVTYTETANKLLRNDGGSWVDATSGPLGDTGNGAAAAWGDMDNDGDLDLYLSNFGGANKLFRNDGGGTFVNVTVSPLTGPTASLGVAWGDIDNDMDLDLCVVATTESSRLYTNNGSGVFTDATAGGMAGVTAGRGVAMGDHDEDGDLDLYISQHNEANVLLRNDDDQNLLWLHVDLVGGRGNPSAIGERVRVVVDGVSQIREIEGGMGYLSQNSLTTEFGLGSSVDGADTVEVRWRSGRLSRLFNPSPNQRITITEPGVLRVPSGYSTIQAAINAAASGDTVLVAAGTYSGVGNRDLDFGGKDLLLAYEGMVPGPWCGTTPVNEAGQVFIDCEGLGRGMIFQNGETSASVVRGLSFVNGYTSGSGGGISISAGAAPVFDRCVIAGNVALARAGGVYFTGSSTSPSFINCTIAGNRSMDRGGGIGRQMGGSLAVTRCIIWGNCADVDGDEAVGLGASVTITCSIVDTTGVLGTPNYVTSVFTNPRFCEQPSCYAAPGVLGSFTLASDSPGLPANNSCAQLMGALGQGCTNAMVAWTGEGDGTTWEDDANWSTGQPQTANDVVIRSVPGTTEVVFTDLVSARLAGTAEAQVGPLSVGSLTSEVPLRLLGGTLQVNGDSELDTLILETGSTLGGTGTITTDVLEWRGGLMTGTGTTHVSDALTLTTSDVKSIRGGRILENEGAWTWPGTGALQHGDGGLGTRLENQSTGVFTVTGARVVDHEATWGTAAALANEGMIAQNANNTTLTVEAVTTNPGTLDVQAGTVNLTGGFTNFAGTTLTGGRYEVADTLRFPGADIQTNAAALVLDGTGSSIVDNLSADALADLATNTATGEVTLENGRDLSVANLSNAGELTLGPASDLTVSNTFVQTGGVTTMSDTTSTIVADTVRVTGGNLSGAGTVTAPLFLNNSALHITNSLEVQGNFEQTPTGELEIELGGYAPGTQYDVLQVSGSAQLGGRLKVDLIPPFDPNVSDAFPFLTATTIAGAFSDVQSFSMASHVNYAATTATAVIDAKHTRFLGAPGSSWFTPGNWTDGLPTAGEDVFVGTSVVVNGGTAVAREVRVLGGGTLTIQNGVVDCDTLRVRSGGTLSLTQEPSMAQASTVRLDAGAGFGWANGRVEIDGGRFDKADPELYVGDSPDTSVLVLRNGAVLNVPGTLRVGRDLGDQGSVVVQGAGTVLNAGSIEVGLVGTGSLQVTGGGTVTTATGQRTTVGRYGTLFGAGTIQGEVKNQGLVSPGPVAVNPASTAGIGTLRVTGSYDQDPTGILEIEVAGTGTGGWDSLQVSSQAQLEGTLRFVRLFALASLPDSASILTYGTRSGTFGTVEVRKAAQDDVISAQTTYLGTALRAKLTGNVGVIGIEEPRTAVAFRVYPNFPNPFRSATTIQFDLPARGDVRLRIYDIQGRLVRTLIDESMEPGAHTRQWLGEDEQGRRTASGVYFYRLEAGRDRQVRRMVKLQ